jgi:hypothetical protein
MSINAHLVLIAFTLAAAAAPVFADDCVAARSAMLDSGHRPHTATTTKTDGQGKKTVTRQIQTVTNKYVQTPDGKWYAMNIAIKDLNDLDSAKLTCRRSGSDSVNGASATVYEVHMDNEGTVTDSKIWVSSSNLILKSESSVEGSRISTEFDFTHATPPANAIAMGGK